MSSICWSIAPDELVWSFEHRRIAVRGAEKHGDFLAAFDPCAGNLHRLCRCSLEELRSRVEPKHLLDAECD
jgi:hypothetical protein